MKLDQQRRWLLAEALVWLAITRLALHLLPFRWIAPRLGDLIPPSQAGAHIASPAGRDTDPAIARQIGWAVRRMSAHVPFRAVCLEKAVAAKIMLRRRGIRSLLYFGVAADGSPTKGLAAHAWLDTVDVRVTGHSAAAAFTMIACFK